MTAATPNGQTPHVERGPVPTEVDVVPLMSSTGRLVMLRWTTPQGENEFYVEAEPAKLLGKAILEAAGGIVVPA